MASIYKDIFKDEKQPFNVRALLSMIFGIIALVSCLEILPLDELLCVAFAVTALVLAHGAGKAQPVGKSAMATAGKVCAIVALCIQAAALLFSFFAALICLLAVLLAVYFIFAAAVIVVLCFVLL